MKKTVKKTFQFNDTHHYSVVIEKNFHQLTIIQDQSLQTMMKSPNSKKYKQSFPIHLTLDQKQGKRILYIQMKRL